MAIVEISVAPLGTGQPGVSEYVADCVEMVASSGLDYQLTPMGTIIEGDLDRIFPLLRRMIEGPFGRGAVRVSSLIKIDDRRDDQQHDMTGKIKAVTSKLVGDK
jgi:uncharacterized protein (TIGR00106 family)